MAVRSAYFKSFHDQFNILNLFLKYAQIYKHSFNRGRFLFQIHLFSLHCEIFQICIFNFKFRKSETSEKRDVGKMWDVTVSAAVRFQGKIQPPVKSTLYCSAAIL